MPPPDPNPDLGFLKQYLADRDTPCPNCRYNLRGVTTSLCPECGRPIALTVQDTSPLRARLPLLILILLWLFAAGSFNAARSGLAIHRTATWVLPPSAQVQSLFQTITPRNMSIPIPRSTASETIAPPLLSLRQSQSSPYAPMPIIRQRGSDNMPIVRPEGSAPMPQIIMSEPHTDWPDEQEYSFGEDSITDLTELLALGRTSTGNFTMRIPMPRITNLAVIPAPATTSGWSSVPWHRWTAFGAWLFLAIVAMLCLARLAVSRRWRLSVFTQRMIHMTAWLAFIAYFSYHSYLFTIEIIL